MILDTLKDSVKIYALRQVLTYIDKNPSNNIPRIIGWIEKHDWGNNMQTKIKPLKKAMADKDGNWYKLAHSLWTDIDDDVRATLFENLVINASMIGISKRRELAEKENCSIPWAILMDPTSACNLKCKGCWAAEYGNKLNMSFDELDDIIQQGKEMGTYFYIFSGGEPLMRKHDIIRLCDKHSDCSFLAFTNATLIDEKFADDMLRVKNFVPAISIEGFEAETDSRRGKGTYSATLKAMRILKEKKLLFGASCCYTSTNTAVIGSENYFDALIEFGAKFVWFFTYIPVGSNAVPELIATAEQREYMYNKVREFRKTKSLFTMDFWNDGEFAGGCIAGGRQYLHINANGDIEPCAFIHYSDSNIREKSLLEAYKSPLFMQYHDNQPFNPNMLRPCPLLDNPEKLVMMVEASGAQSTEILHPEDVNDLTGKCSHTAKCWAETADKLWEKSLNNKAKQLIKHLSH
ncbi:MAG: radical SAM protein [Clostridiales bacterium]|nr:radical SAM protein [Clostridiales bacterium]